jgi:prevent-host-death family protein
MVASSGRKRVEVGIRELRNHLSAYLERVKEGDEVVVTDRGQAVARLLPMGMSKLEQLIAEGLVTPPKEPNKDYAGKPVKAKGTVSDLVAEQRR